MSFVHKPILAERFKTKVCQNFETTGVCPYETRCMFAHGPHELRTKQMNLNDNLVTEEAIKAFQKARAIAARSALKKKERAVQKKMATKAALAAAAAGGLLSLVPEHELHHHRAGPGGRRASNSFTSLNDSSTSTNPTAHLSATDISTAFMHTPRSCCAVTPTHEEHLNHEEGAVTTPHRSPVYELRFDATKFVSPLAAAMLCRPTLVSEVCHCEICREADASKSSHFCDPFAWHHDDSAAAILLA